jgi:hypothetical protein
MNVRFWGWLVINVDSVLWLLHCMHVSDTDITGVHSASICRVEVYRLVSCADSDFHAAQPLTERQATLCLMSTWMADYSRTSVANEVFDVLQGPQKGHLHNFSDASSVLARMGHQFPLHLPPCSQSVMYMYRNLPNYTLRPWNASDICSHPHGVTM